jgi:hypothetical protein
MKKRDREHQHVSERLSAYMDDELAARERTRVEGHLSTCGQCRADLRTLRWTKRLLRETPHVRVPRTFVVREADVLARRPARRWPSLFAVQWATAAVALLFVLVLGGDLLTTGQLRMAGQAAPQAEMAQSEWDTLSVAQEVEALPEGTALPVPAEKVEADVTQVAREVAATEVVEEKAVELEVAETEMERAAKPEMDEDTVVPRPLPPPGEFAKEGQADHEAGIGATGVTTPTAAPPAMAVAPQTATPILEAQENQVLGDDTPAAVPPEEGRPTAYSASPPRRLLLSARSWWRVAEVLLGATLVGLVVLVVWMRRR